MGRGIVASVAALLFATSVPSLIFMQIGHALLEPIAPIHQALVASWTIENVKGFMDAGGWHRIEIALAITNWIVAPLCQILAGSLVGVVGVTRVSTFGAGVGLASSILSLRGTDAPLLRWFVTCVAYTFLTAVTARLCSQSKARRRSAAR